MSKRKKTYGFLLLVAIFAAVGYVAFPLLNSDAAVSSADSPEAAEAKKEESNVPVEIAVARRGEISSSTISTANLRANREVSVAVQAEGVVKEVLVEEGDYVGEKQLLARLDDTEYQIRLQSARQKLAQAKLQLEKASILHDKSEVQVRNTRDELVRYQNLFDENLVSEREVAQIRYRMDELEHDLRATSSESRELTHRVDELKAEIEQSELEISRTLILAPFSGVLTQRTVVVGQTVRSMDRLFTIGDLTPLEADVFLSEREAARIHAGQWAMISSAAAGGAGVQGLVSRISPVVDQSTGTVKVTLELAKPDTALKPGAFVRVEIRTDSRSGSVLVPKRAVFEEEGAKYVFLNQDSTAHKVAVELGYQEGSEVEILSGIQEGDSVVVAGQGGLKDGTKVKSVEPVNPV